MSVAPYESDRVALIPGRVLAPFLTDGHASDATCCHAIALQGMHPVAVGRRDAVGLERPCGRSSIFTARPRCARLTAPPTSKGGDPVNLIISTPATPAVTTIGIYPALVQCCP